VLDGLWANPARMGVMRRRLAAAGVGRVEAFAYASSGRRCLKEQGAKLVERLISLGGEVNLIGYSMGGLVARSALRQAPELPVKRAVFVNTPHQGSMLAWLLPGAGIAQMRPGSQFLADLDASPPSIPALAIWTPGDLMVIPAKSACWKNAAKTLVCRMPAHVWPLFSISTHRAIAEFLLEP